MKKNILISKTSQSLMEKILIFKENVSSEESFEEDLMITSVKTCLSYEEVYSEDESENEDILPSQSVDSIDIYSRLFILVNVPSKQFRGQKFKDGKTYCYVAICQSTVDSERLVSVLFLKSQGCTKTAFIADNNDVTDVQFINTVGKLQQPKVKPKGLFTNSLLISSDS